MPTSDLAHEPGANLFLVPVQDIRIEERSYVRENKSLNSSKRSMVMQERLFFRNIPLSNWIEHEMVVEEGNNLDQLPAPESVFATPALNGDTRPVVSKFLDENNNGRLPVTYVDFEDFGIDRHAIGPAINE